MTPRPRPLTLILAVLAVPALVGCSATVVTGAGTMADGGGRIVGGSATAPGGDAGAGDTTVTRAVGSDDSRVCQIYSDNDLRAVFGQDVTVEPFVDDNSCQFTLDDGGFVVIAYWESQTPHEVFDPVGAPVETMFDERPAVRAGSEIAVALGGDLDSPGAVTGSSFLIGVDTDGDLPVLSPLLAKAADIFAG